MIQQRINCGKGALVPPNKITMDTHNLIVLYCITDVGIFYNFS